METTKDSTIVLFCIFLNQTSDRIFRRARMLDDLYYFDEPFDSDKKPQTFSGVGSLPAKNQIML